jgi:chromosome segregation ATPase
MANSISLEQLTEQQEQLNKTVSNLIAQKATLEDQLENCKATLSSNQGALQYANALIESLVNNPERVGGENVAEEIDVPAGSPVEVEEAEEVTL